MSFEILAEGLQFPEGPIVLPDGTIILVEIDAGLLTRIWNGKREVVAEIGGGPNGAAFGPDGAIYVCNSGGRSKEGKTGPQVRGRIERVDLATGKFERVYDSVDGHPLSAPNDLVFDRAGGFWFTDFGATYARRRDLSGVYYAAPDGSRVTEVSFGATGYNGVGLSPDETTVYAAESYTGRLIAFDLAAPGQVVKGGRGGRLVAGHADRRFFDSLAVQADGAVCVATIGFGAGEGGVTTIAPDGSSELVNLPDRAVTNICFGGEDMRDAYVTLSATGRLLRTRWPSPGLKLNYNPY
jgi:gluconolactonase